MSDYIKREDAKDAVINIVGWKKIAMYVDEMSNHPSTKDIDYYDALMDAEDAIADLPSADVAPIRRGRWIDTDRYGFPVMECSECGAQTGTLNFPYCFNCGARMDGEENEWPYREKRYSEVAQKHPK